jgi:hypothetical protein
MHDMFTLKRFHATFFSMPINSVYTAAWCYCITEYNKILYYVQWLNNRLFCYNRTRGFSRGMKSPRVHNTTMHNVLVNLNDWLRCGLRKQWSMHLGGSILQNVARVLVVQYIQHAFVAVYIFTYMVNSKSTKKIFSSIKQSNATANVL